MTHDANHPTAANDNELSAGPVQLELDLQQPADRAEAPRAAEPPVAPARAPTPAPPARASAPAPNRKPAKVANKSSARKTVDLPPTSSPAAAAAAEPDPPDPSTAEVIRLKAERIARDSRIRELNEIADDAFLMARDRKRYAQAGADTWQEEDANFKQWALLAATHARSITAIQKHIEFLNREW
jgi:hypothetical protein